MPIYEYACRGCGHHQDEIRKMSERSEPTECEECGGKAQHVEIVQTARPKFVGPGFYATDYDTKHPWRLEGVEDEPPDNIDDYENLDERK